MYIRKGEVGSYITRYVHIGIASHARGHWFKSSIAHHEAKGNLLTTCISEI